MPIVPSVTTNGGMRSRVTIRPLNKTAQRARAHQADQNAERDRIAALERHRSDQTAQPENRTHRKIDAARDDDDRHAERHRIEDCRLPRDAGEVVRGQEVGRGNRERDEQNDQAEERQQLLGEAFMRRFPERPVS